MTLSWLLVSVLVSLGDRKSPEMAESRGTGNDSKPLMGQEKPASLLGFFIIARVTFEQRVLGSSPRRLTFPCGARA
jgi:hypothetical protein